MDPIELSPMRNQDRSNRRALDSDALRKDLLNIDNDVRDASDELLILLDAQLQPKEKWEEVQARLRGDDPEPEPYTKKKGNTRGISFAMEVRRAHFVYDHAWEDGMADRGLIEPGIPLPLDDTEGKPLSHRPSGLDAFLATQVKEEEEAKFTREKAAVESNIKAALRNSSQQLLNSISPRLAGFEGLTLEATCWSFLEYVEPGQRSTASLLTASGSRKRTSNNSMNRSGNSSSNLGCQNTGLIQRLELQNKNALPDGKRALSFREKLSNSLGFLEFAKCKFHCLVCISSKDHEHKHHESEGRPSDHADHDHILFMVIADEDLRSPAKITLSSDDIVLMEDWAAQPCYDGTDNESIFQLGIFKPYQHRYKFQADTFDTAQRWLEALLYSDEARQDPRWHSDPRFLSSGFGGSRSSGPGGGQYIRASQPSIDDLGTIEEGDWTESKDCFKPDISQRIDMGVPQGLPNHSTSTKSSNTNHSTSPGCCFCFSTSEDTSPSTQQQHSDYRLMGEEGRLQR